MGHIDRFTPPATDSARHLHAVRATGAVPRRPRRVFTPAEVAAVLEALYPPPSGQPGDQSLPRQQLTSAFLAGVAHAQERLLPHSSGGLTEASVRVARALLKNRAATQQDRLCHAFRAGVHAAHAHLTTLAQAAGSAGALRLFIRQPLTESGEAQQAMIAAVLDRIEEHNGKPHPFHYLAGRQAETADTFRTSFEADSGQAFTPQAFRAHRLGLLAQADAFVNIRVGMSESSAFELSYHVFRGACTPVLFLVWKHAPIKTTLLKDLGNLCDVTYMEFEHAKDLAPRLGEFFRRCKRRAAAGFHSGPRAA